MAKTKKKSKPKTAAIQPIAQGFSWPWHYLAIVLVVLLFAGIRLRLRDFPLERDEGEYAYAGQLILQGIPPYQLAYNMKLPGTYAAYSAILAVFGQSPAGIHVGLLVVNAATTLLIFFLAFRLFGATAGVVAGASYALLSTSPSILGLAGHATHFVVLPAVIGLLLLLEAAASKKTWTYLLSGVFVGIAFVMKQPGICFVLFAGLYLLRLETKPPIDWRNVITRVAAYSLGAVLPYATTCLILYRAGAFKKFWFWTASYASQYGTTVSIPKGLGQFVSVFPKVVAPSIVIWILAAVGLSAFWWDRTIRPQAEFVVGLLIFSFLAVCAGLYFREHYFILILPAVAVLAGVAVSSTTERLSQDARMRTLRFVPALAFLLGFAYSLYDQKGILFEMDMTAACRSIYGANPFPEAIEIANYIKNHSAADSQVAVLGSEPEIYFYSGRHSATGYIYTYPLMEEQKYALPMQKEMIGEIEAARPEFLVFVRTPTSWLLRASSERLILSWAQRYVHDQYSLVGISETVGQTGTYYWDADAATHQPRSPFVVLVFKRNT